MDIVNNCIVKEEVDLTLEEEEEEEEEEDDEEGEEKEDFLVDNCDQNENNVYHDPVEFTSLNANTVKSVQEFPLNDPALDNMKNGCQRGNCKLKCYDISPDHKAAIFQHFWRTLNLHEKLEFISCHICIFQGVKSVHRNYFFRINGRLRRVCHKTFLETLNIKRTWILIALKKFNRSSNDFMSHFISDKGKNVRSNYVNHDSENFQSGNVDLNESKTQPAEGLSLRLIDAENSCALQSRAPQGNNNEIETIILDNDENSALQNCETMTREETNTTVINEINCENIIELNSDEDDDDDDDGDDTDSNVNVNKVSANVSYKPCCACYPCVFPKEQKQQIAHHFWRVRSYSEKINFMANHIKVIEKEKKGKFVYTYEFFLNFNSFDSNVCEFGFQKVLSVSNAWFTAAMHKALEQYCSKQIENSSENTPTNETVEDKINHLFDEELANLWNKAKRLKSHFYAITGRQIQRSNGILSCEKECELSCQMTESQWTLISNEFWKIETIRELRQYILNYVQFLTLKNKPCRKYFLKIDGKLKKVCRSFFLETLSIKNEIIEVISRESNPKLTNSVENQSASTSLETEENSLVGQKVRLPCDAFYHNKCRQILEDQRQRIFRSFWLLNSNLERYKYISKLVERKDKDNLIYFLDIDGVRERVCQLMFEATFDIHDQWIKKALSKLGYSPNVIKRKTINSTLKRPLTSDVMLTNAKKVAHSLPKSAKEIDTTNDLEIIDISNDSIDFSVKEEIAEPASPKFEMVTVMEMKKEVEEAELTQPMKIQSEKRIETETENQVKAANETETKGFFEIILDNPLKMEESMENVPEEEIIEINFEEEEPKEIEVEMNGTPMPIEIVLDEKEVIEIDSEDEETETSSFRDEFQKKKSPRRTIGIFSHRKGQFCKNNCKNRCYLFNNENRDIFRNFWNIESRFDKFEFISEHVDVTPGMVEDVRDDIIRARILKYFLDLNEERVNVCEETFLTVLGINVDWIYNVLNYFGRSLANFSIRDRIRLHTPYSRKMCTEEINSIVAFEAGLPCLTSKGTSLPERKMKKSCVRCKFMCKQFSHQQREEIFHNFWNISSRRKKYDFLWNHIKEQQHFLELNGKLVEVCPAMFIGTLNIDLVWIEKLDKLRQTAEY